MYYKRTKIATVDVVVIDRSVKGVIFFLFFTCIYVTPGKRKSSVVNKHENPS